ncbi:MAG: hypothetical protein H6Q93_672 [Nitrospirae bacterium]|nr:hypothetical protein [Nitrospirota bacterium]
MSLRRFYEQICGKSAKEEGDDPCRKNRRRNPGISDRKRKGITQPVDKTYQESEPGGNQPTPSF